MTRMLFAAILFVFTLCYAVGNSVAEIGSPPDGCVCEKFGCSCCLYMDVPQIWLNDTVCIVFGYDPDSYGISFVLTIDDKALINETISAKNPPPICVPVPLIEDFVDICVHFTDLSISNQDFHGCVAIEFRMWWVYVIAEIKLGCFDTDERCKTHIDKVIINKVPRFHNLTMVDKYKYNLVPMQDMMPVNEAENISDYQKEVVNFHLLNATKVSPRENASFHFLNVSAVFPKEKVNFHLLNVTTVSPKKDTSFHLFNVTTVPPKEEVSVLLLNITTVTPNQNILVNKTISKPVISKVNHSMILEDLPFCAGKSNLVSLPFLLFLLVLQRILAVFLKYF